MLLHIPIMGRFSICYNEFNEVADLLFDLLEVKSSNEKQEMRQLRCQHVRLSWPRDVYEWCCKADIWKYAAKTYLLHLVGYIIFVDKSTHSVAIKYFILFRNLGNCENYA